MKVLGFLRKEITFTGAIFTVFIRWISVEFFATDRAMRKFARFKTLSSARLQTFTAFVPGGFSCFVNNVMFSQCHQLKICGAIITSVSIDMVHKLVAIQITSKKLFHHESMLKHVASRISVRMIRLINDTIAPLVTYLCSHRSKYSTGGC